MDPIQINFFTRPSCHLCQRALEVLNSLRDEISFQLIEIDVSASPQLEEFYGGHVPVATVSEQELFRHRVQRRQLRQTLLALAGQQRD